MVFIEEKLFEILARYKAYNNHAESYTWKYHCNPLNMSTTLGTYLRGDWGEGQIEVRVKYSKGKVEVKVGKG